MKVIYDVDYPMLSVSVVREDDGLFVLDGIFGVNRNGIIKCNLGYDVPQVRWMLGGMESLLSAEVCRGIIRSVVNCG